MPVLDFENEPLGTYTKFVGGTPTGLVADVVEDGGVKVLRLEATDGFVAAFLSDIPAHDDEETRSVMRRGATDGDCKFYHKNAGDSLERLQCGYEQGSGVFQRGFTIQAESAMDLDPTQYFVAEVMPPSGGTLDWRIYPEGAGTLPAFATWSNNINAGQSGEVGVAINNGATIFVKEIGTVTASGTDTIAGTVKTSGGYPLAGATITVDGSVVATTDSKGVFSYESASAPDSATVDADGYDSSSESLSAGSSNDVTLALQPPTGWGAGMTLEDPNLGHYSNSQVPMWDLLQSRGLTWTLNAFGSPEPWRQNISAFLALDEWVIMNASQWNSRRIDAYVPLVEGGRFVASAIGGNSSREVDLWQSDDPRIIVSGGFGHNMGGYAEGTVSGPAVEVMGEVAEVTSQSRGSAFIGACAAYALQEYDANDIWTARAALRHGASGYPAWSEPNGYGELLHNYTLADPLTLDIQGPVAIEVEHTATDELTLRWQQFLMWNHQATVVKRVDGTNDDIIFEGDAASFVWDVSGVSGTVTLEFLSRDIDGNLSTNITPQVRTFDIPTGAPVGFSYTPPARSYPSYTEGTLEHTIVQRFNPLRLWRPDASGSFIEESGSGDNLAPDTTHGSVTHRTGAGDLVTENSDWGVLDIKGGAFLEGAVDIPDSPAQYSLLFVVEFDTSKTVENFFQLSGTNDFRSQNNILGVSYTGVVGTFLVQADGLRGPFSSTWGGDRGALQSDGVHVIGMGGFDSTAHWYNASDRTIDERNDLQWIRIDGWDTLAIAKGSISGGGSDQDERIEARIQAIALIDEAWTKEDADAVHTALTESPPAPVEETYTFAGNASPSGTLIEVLDGSTVLASTLETGGTWDTSFDMDPAELPASVTVRASADGFVTDTETVSLDPAVNSYTGINFALTEETPSTVTRTGTVTRNGSAVQGAEVVLISKADLIASATATATTDSSGGYTVEVPTGEEMVVIGLDGEDGDSAAVTESG